QNPLPRPGAPAPDDLPAAPGFADPENPAPRVRYCAKRYRRPSAPHRYRRAGIVPAPETATSCTPDVRADGHRVHRESAEMPAPQTLLREFRLRRVLRPGAYPCGALRD